RAGLRRGLLAVRAGRRRDRPAHPKLARRLPGMTALVGVDVGTSSTKAIAIEPDGTIVGHAQAEYRVGMPQPGHAEQDPELWWGAAHSTLDELGVPHPAGIGLTGQMHGLVLLDERLRPLRPAILWNDQRTAAECEEIERTVGLERLIALTGN